MSDEDEYINEKDYINELYEDEDFTLNDKYNNNHDNTNYDNDEESDNEEINYKWCNINSCLTCNYHSFDLTNFSINDYKECIICNSNKNLQVNDLTILYKPNNTDLLNCKEEMCYTSAKVNVCDNYFCKSAIQHINIEVLSGSNHFEIFNSIKEMSNRLKNDF